MGTSNYCDEFKRDAVQQIRVRGYPVREVSQRLGVSSHSLYKWMKLFAESWRYAEAKIEVAMSITSSPDGRHTVGRMPELHRPCRLYCRLDRDDV